MIDLNSKQFDSVSKIFNNGEAGKVDNVTIGVQRKQASDNPVSPDFKLLIKDELGNSINGGFYYPKANAQKDAEQNEAAAKREVSRVVHVAKAVVGPDYEFPAVKTSKDAFDVLFKIIEDEAGDKKFSVFVTYGTKGYASKYLGIRYFNFIEPMGANPTRLKVTPQDLLERIDPDTMGASSSSSSAKVEDEEWL